MYERHLFAEGPPLLTVMECRQDRGTRSKILLWILQLLPSAIYYMRRC